MEWMTRIRCDPAEERVVSCIAYIAFSVGELFLWKPTLTALRRNDSNWSRWAAFVNPHHAEEAYWSFEMTVAWNTVCSGWSSNPCDLRTRSAYNDWADELMTDETCSCIEKLLHSVTPMIFREFTRWMPGMVGTSVVPRERGFLNMISWDLDLFNDNLFSLAHCCICSSSRSRVWALDAGMTKLESSANLNISFPAVIGRRSDAVTMYANGPRPEPWMTLAIIALKADSTSLNFVQCVWPVKKSITQLYTFEGRSR